MMSNTMMTFPDTIEEFMEIYKQVDTEQIYSNGTEYVPIYRIKQWINHNNAFVKHGKWIDPAAEDCYRCSVCEEYTHMEMPRLLYHYCPNCGAKMSK